jgi:cell division protein ZapA (FtsZ GTPase activity inhibitor)
MKLIQNNPYRIIGLLSNVTEKDLQKQKSKITKYASIGKQIESEFDFPFLTQIIRNEEHLTQAFSKVEQNKDKVSNAIFWFSVSNSFDNDFNKIILII